MARLDDELMARLERLATSEGLELLAVEVGGTARKPVVRVVLDRAEGGVNLSDCESVSRQASALLDVFDPFPAPYTLEVTSPGIDRKMYNDKDYARFAGQPVRVRMKPSWRHGSRLIEGVLVGKDAGMIHVRDRADAVHALPEAEVFETRIDPFPAGPRGGAAKPKR